MVSMIIYRMQVCTKSLVTLKFWAPIDEDESSTKTMSTSALDGHFPKVLCYFKSVHYRLNFLFYYLCSKARSTFLAAAIVRSDPAYLRILFRSFLSPSIQILRYIDNYKLSLASFFLSIFVACIYLVVCFECIATYTLSMVYPTCAYLFVQRIHILTESMQAYVVHMVIYILDYKCHLCRLCPHFL